jgi:signal transduction histidine kinase
LAFSPALSAQLAQLAPGGVRARVLAPGAWVLAQSGRLHEGAAASGWLAALVSRALVAAPLDAAAPWMDDAPRLDTPSVRAALAGTPTADWRDGQARGSAVLSVVVPIVEHGRQRGALMLEQASRAVPLLANRALFGLLLASFGVLLVAGLVLFAFATRLSMRLGRLRDAAERAQANDGRYDGPFPLTTDADELGDLARSFARLFDAVGGYTTYLRTLASKLSHELNTPLAIVKSSLDNLEHAAMPADAQPYLQRARDGVSRMVALVRAMGEASRMEHAIAAAEPEDFDLAEVVRGCAESYRALAGAQRIEADLPDTAVPLHGAPELVAQALDKLFDNARSFTPADGWIRIGLRATDDGAELTVANQGPPLPASMQGRLFDSLVSLRENAGGGEAPHLGLGLYVVRLVAERHGGGAGARNLDDAGGVVFTVRLRGMPRPRLG